LLPALFMLPMLFVFSFVLAMAHTGCGAFHLPKATPGGPHQLEPRGPSNDQTEHSRHELRPLRRSRHPGGQEGRPGRHVEHRSRRPNRCDRNADPLETLAAAIEQAGYPNSPLPEEES
jgi:hypothetical protein